jgi:hypothetical protein
VHLQLDALAYNLGNFMLTLTLPNTAEPWSRTRLREKLIKIGAKVVSDGKSCPAVASLRPRPPPGRFYSMQAPAAGPFLSVSLAQGLRAVLERRENRGGVGDVEVKLPRHALGADLHLALGRTGDVVAKARADVRQDH